PQAERAQLGKSAPQLGVEPRRLRLAHGLRGAVLVEEARERVADHFLFVGQVEVHAGCARRIILEISIWPVASEPMNPPSTGSTTPVTMAASAELSSTT